VDNVAGNPVGNRLMARIRSVKPELRTSEVVASWPFEIRYFFVLLWGYLDDCGRGLDVPKTIAGDCFPHDEKVTPSKVEKWLKIMAMPAKGIDRPPPICRYEHAGRRYIHCVNWHEHQKPNRPSPSRLPPCPLHESLTEPLSESSSEPLSDCALSPHVLEFDSRGAGEQGRGTARPAPPVDKEPPPKCHKHQNDPNPPPCGACRDARLQNDTWHTTKRARLANATQCPRHRGQPADNCAGCRADALAAPTGAHPIIKPRT